MRHPRHDLPERHDLDLPHLINPDTGCVQSCPPGCPMWDVVAAALRPRTTTTTTQEDS